jgi:predicted MPP superfamily phosphohydrolase
MVVHMPKIQRLAWATDIHINFVSDGEVLEFCASIRQGAYDALVITGDIAEGQSVCGYLRTFAAQLDLPVYFVLRNHDFYDARIKDVRDAVTELSRVTSSLHYLPTAGVVPLTDRTALVCCDGWGDLHHGKGFESRVELQDHYGS